MDYVIFINMKIVALIIVLYSGFYLSAKTFKLLAWVTQPDLISIGKTSPSTSRKNSTGKQAECDWILLLYS